MATHKKKRQSKIADRINSMSHEEIAERWRQMRPRYYRWLALFTMLSIILYLINHALIMQYSAEALKRNDLLVKLIGVLNAGFQISSIFWMLFAFLVGMSYFYGKAPATAAE